MSTVIYVGGNDPERSTYLVAYQIHERIPGSAIVHSLSDPALKDATIINLVDTDIDKLVKSQRYNHYKKLINLMAWNFNEMTLPEKLSLMGHTVCETLVVHSAYSYETVRKFVRSMFAPSIARNILDNLKLHLYGVEDSFQPGSNDRCMFIVPYNRINQGFKNISIHAHVTREVQSVLLARGVVTDHLFIRGKFDDRDPSLLPYRVKTQGTRDEFRQTISQAGMFICTSLSESFGIYYLELLCSGVVGVFLDRPWVRLLLPKYPYIAANHEDLAAMTIHVFDNYKAIHEELLQSIAPDIHERYNLDRFVKDLVC